MIRFIPEMSLLFWGMSTHRSRGIEMTVTDLVAGTKRATMVTSLRWPPASASSPNALIWVGLLTKARESEPTSSTLKGWPGLAACFTRCFEWIFGISSKR